MRIGTRIFALVLITAVAAPTVAPAHEGEGGEPAHMGVISDGIDQWHEHPTAESLAAEREENRRWQCSNRLAEWRRYTNSADGADAYAYRKMTEKCADQETDVGKHICKGAQRDYKNNRAGLMAGIRARHDRAAEVCKPEEMQARHD